MEAFEGMARGESEELVSDWEIFAMLDEEIAHQIIPRQAGCPALEITD